MEWISPFYDREELDYSVFELENCKKLVAEKSSIPICGNSPISSHSFASILSTSPLASPSSPDSQAQFLSLNLTLSTSTSATSSSDEEKYTPSSRVEKKLKYISEEVSNMIAISWIKDALKCKNFQYRPIMEIIYQSNPKSVLPCVRFDEYIWKKENLFF